MEKYGPKKVEAQFDRHDKVYKDINVHWKQAMEKMDWVNEYFALNAGSYTMEWCPTLIPIDANPFKGFRLQWGEETITTYYGVPTYFSVIDDVEKYTKKKYSLSK